MRIMQIGLAATALPLIACGQLPSNNIELEALRADYGNIEQTVQQELNAARASASTIPAASVPVPRGEADPEVAEEEAEDPTPVSGTSATRYDTENFEKSETKRNQNSRTPR